MEYQNTSDWVWTVHFDDGSTLEEYPNGVHTHAWADIQREIDAGKQVRHMVLTPSSERPDLRPAIVALAPGQHPIFFRRGHLPHPMGDGPAEPPYTTHCLGLRRPGTGHDSIVYLHLMPDGGAVLTTSLNEV